MVVQKKRHTIPTFQVHILNAIYQKFKNYNHGEIGKRLKKIVGFTEYKLTTDESNGEQNIIRCCPNFRSENDWYDWVVAEWDDYGELEGQCLMFLDFNLKEMETFDIMSHCHEGMNESHSIISKGECLLLHSIEYTENDVYKRSCCSKSKTSIEEANYISNRLCKFAEMEDQYHIVSVECIKDTTMCIPFEYKSKNETYLPGCSKSVFVMKKYSLWHKHFIDYDDQNLINEGNTRRDSRISLSDGKYPFEG